MPFIYRHEEEVKTAKGENNQEEFLTVNLDKMLTVLNNVFTVPRNYRSASLRDAASDYITQKFGNLGLLVGLQYFYPSRFYNQVRSMQIRLYTIFFSWFVLLACHKKSYLICDEITKLRNYEFSKYYVIFFFKQLSLPCFGCLSFVLWKENRNMLHEYSKIRNFVTN